mgnify:FL=1
MGTVLSLYIVQAEGEEEDGMSSPHCCSKDGPCCDEAIGHDQWCRGATHEGIRLYRNGECIGECGCRCHGAKEDA